MSLEQEQTPAPEARLARLAKALSDPASIALLKILSDRTTCVTDNLPEASLLPAVLAGRLRELKAVGLVQGEIEGANTCYCLDLETVSELQGLVTGLFLGASAIDRKRCC